MIDALFNVIIPAIIVCAMVGYIADAIKSGLFRVALAIENKEASQAYIAALEGMINQEKKDVDAKSANGSN